MAAPPVIRKSLGENLKPGVFGRQVDPAQYIVERSRFQRPTLRIPPNGPKYEWPIGVEGLRIEGATGLAEHRYLGDNAPVVTVTHRDARRITLSGTFPGVTGATNMRDMLEVITSVAPKGYWILSLPSGIFPREQLVVIENYEVERDPEERSDGFSYSITMVRTGVGGKVVKKKSTASPTNPNTKKPKKGKSNRSFTTKKGGNTLRAVSKIVYGNANKWQQIYSLNKAKLDKLGIPLHQLQYKHLAYGIKLSY